MSLKNVVLDTVVAIFVYKQLKKYWPPQFLTPVALERNEIRLESSNQIDWSLEDLAILFGAFLTYLRFKVTEVYKNWSGQYF